MSQVALTYLVLGCVVGFVTLCVLHRSITAVFGRQSRDAHKKVYFSASSRKLSLVQRIRKVVGNMGGWWRSENRVEEERAGTWPESIKVDTQKHTQTPAPPSDEKFTSIFPPTVIDLHYPEETKGLGIWPDDFTTPRSFSMFGGEWKQQLRNVNMSRVAALDQVAIHA